MSVKVRAHQAGEPCHPCEGPLPDEDRTTKANFT